MGLAPCRRSFILPLNNEKNIIPNKNNMDNELQKFLNDLKQNKSNIIVNDISESNKGFSSY